MFSSLAGSYWRFLIRTSASLCLSSLRAVLTAPAARQQGPGGVGAPLDQRWNSDVRPVLRGELRTLDRELANAIPRSADRMTRLHLEDARAEIARLLDPQEAGGR